MGSIHNLLNPLSNTPSPQRHVLSPSSAQQQQQQQQQLPRPRENDHTTTVSRPIQNTPNSSTTTSSSYYPQRPLSPTATTKQHNTPAAGYIMESIQVEPMQRTPSSDRGRTGSGGAVALGEIRVLSPVRGMKGSSDAGGNRSRRTSTSSLADLLNPVETSPILNVSSRTTTQLTPAKSSPSTARTKVSPAPAPAPPPHRSPPTFVVSPVAMEKIDENDEDMNIDIVTVEEDKPTTAITNTTAITTTMTFESRQSVAMQKSKSTDSERTIDDPVTSLPVPKPPTPTPPSPSRKRKFTPESSPDEPLAHELPLQPDTTSSAPAEPTVLTETPVPAPPPKAVKKPKKAPVKRPPSVKKRQVGNGQKKRPSIAKEKAESVDNISSTRQSSITASEASTSSYESTARTSKQLYCICHKPDNGTWMINCEICNDWFHGSCVSLEESDEPLIDTYVCPPCTTAGKGKTTWIRKCRLEGCKNPAIQATKPGAKGNKGIKGSKYCSDDHAREFFRRKLNSLDTETLTKEALKALLDGVTSVDQLKVLGAEEPVPLPETELSKFRTAEDESRSADLRLEREKIQRKLEIVALRQQFLHFVIEKTKSTNADLKAAQPAPTTGKSKTKPKELCGYNDRLSLDDTEFLEWSGSEEGKKVFAEKRVEERVNCVVEKRRCRHVGWQQLRGEDILMEESLLRDQLDGIQREENILRERQKVRARNANTGNFTQVVG